MKVLMIDDEPSREKILRNHGLLNCDITIALGFDQLEFYLDGGLHSFDLILLDHDMRDQINGYDVCEQFLIERNIPVIIISTNEPASKRMLGLLEEYGVDAVYAPITRPADLIQEIRKYRKETK